MTNPFPTGFTTDPALTTGTLATYPDGSTVEFAYEQPGQTATEASLWTLNPLQSPTGPTLYTDPLLGYTVNPLDAGFAQVNGQEYFLDGTLIGPDGSTTAVDIASELIAYYVGVNGVTQTPSQIESAFVGHTVTAGTFDSYGLVVNQPAPTPTPPPPVHGHEGHEHDLAQIAAVLHHWA